MAEREGAAYFCSHCGYSPDNDGGYCALGCGRDYNEMMRVPQRHIDKLLRDKGEIVEEAIAESLEGSDTP